MKKYIIKALSVVMSAAVLIVAAVMPITASAAAVYPPIIDASDMFIGEPAAEIYGIDVSRYQGDIDWGKVSGFDGGKIKFAMVRLGSGAKKAGGELQLDDKFDYNVRSAYAAGLKVGVYYVPHSDTAEQAVTEARAVIELLKPYIGCITYPFALDWEHINAQGSNLKDYNGDPLSDTAVADITTAFLHEMTQAEWFTSVYTDVDTISNRSDSFDKRVMWAADYGISPREALPRGTYMLQYTDTAKVDGIAGNVDLDIAFVDFEHYITSRAYNNLPLPTPPFVPGPDTQARNIYIDSFMDTNPHITVHWDYVGGADVKYAVYYCALKSDRTYGEWTIKVVADNSVVVDTSLSGAKYYITILPFSDVPRRQYGGFSPYMVFETPPLTPTGA